MAVHQHQMKPFQPQPKNSPQFELQSKKYNSLRLLLLCLLLASALCSVSKLAIPPPPPPKIFKDAHKVHGTQILTIILFLFPILTLNIDPDFAEARKEAAGYVEKDEAVPMLYCDRSHKRTDVCYMKGDIRTDSISSSVVLYAAEGGGNGTEKVRPYTRKWETSIMSTVDEIALRRGSIDAAEDCDVRHNVPAVVFSTGGYTGNVYHEFNDGLIPLYITAEGYGGEVVFVVLEYHSWWKTKFDGVVSRLSRYKMVDFSKDLRVHCFPEMVVGLKIHGELMIDSKLMPTGKTINDFQTLLDQGFGTPVPQNPTGKRTPRPKLAIFVRNKSRVIQNLKEIVKLCERTGFEVQILNPKRTTPLTEIYGALSSSHAMMAVHGAAMTHFLFMKPGKTVIQIVPLGLDWAAEEYYGVPARKLGLRYVGYKINPTESSLYRKYDRKDPVIRDPDAITSKGWSETKKIYLEAQNVRLNVRKFGKVIAKVHSEIVRSL